MSVEIGNKDNGCVRDIETQWLRCWGLGGAGYMGSGEVDDISVGTWEGVGSAWTTRARVYYLTCKQGVWTEDHVDASLGCVWTGWRWEFDILGKPVSLPLQ